MHKLSESYGIQVINALPHCRITRGWSVVVNTRDFLHHLQRKKYITAYFNQHIF